MKLCTEALPFPDSAESKVYLRALLQLNLSFSNPSHTRDLHTLVRKLLRTVKDKIGLKLVEQFNILVERHLVRSSGDSADSAADDVPMETENAVPESQPRKPRTRQLGSKHGTTLLMDATASDAEMSQSSADVFFSPVSSSTQKEKTNDKSTSEEVISESNSRYFIFYKLCKLLSSILTFDFSNSEKVVPRKTRRTTDREMAASAVDSDEDVIPPTPPQRTTRSRRVNSKR